MERYSADQLACWMDGALIRRLNDLTVDEVMLDTKVRIAAFRDGWQLAYLKSSSVCQITELKKNKLDLYAVDQRPRELHFALRKLSTYKLKTLKDFVFGASFKVSVRAGNVYSLNQLLAQAQAQGVLTWEGAFKYVQDDLEPMWRNALEEDRETDWTYETCRQGLERVNDRLAGETRRVFRRYGLICCGKAHLQSVSEPLYMYEY